MGASGSGKSTTMNILGCLDVPTSGAYLFRGVPRRGTEPRPALAAAPPLSRLRLPGLQSAGAHHGAGECRTAAAVSRREPARRGTSRAWPRSPRSGSPTGRITSPNELSGGQQQRVAIARAHWSPSPMCCSPTSQPAISTPNGRSRSWNCWPSSMPRRGLTVLLVTHEPEMAAYRAQDRPFQGRPRRPGPARGKVMTTRLDPPDHEHCRPP